MLFDINLCMFSLCICACLYLVLNPFAAVLTSGARHTGHCVLAMCGTAGTDQLTKPWHMEYMGYIWATGVRASECYSWQVQRWEAQ